MEKRLEKEVEEQSDLKELVEQKSDRIRQLEQEVAVLKHSKSKIQKEKDSLQTQLKEFRHSMMFYLVAANEGTYDQ